MKTWIIQQLTDSIIQWLKEFRSQLGPQLCCEKEDINAEHTISLIIEVIQKWNRDWVLCVVYLGNRWRACVTSPGDLKGLLENATITEEIVSIVDLSLPGGCSVDFTPTSDHTFEVLFTAWGSHEQSASEFAQKLGDVATFRGN